MDATRSSGPVRTWGSDIETDAWILNGLRRWNRDEIETEWHGIDDFELGARNFDFDGSTRPLHTNFAGKSATEVAEAAMEIVQHQKMNASIWLTGAIWWGESVVGPTTRWIAGLSLRQVSEVRCSVIFQIPAFDLHRLIWCRFILVFSVNY